jgi:flagellar biosynthesis GTPase FlhF
MADKTVEEKLDAIFDSISKRMDATDARLDAACSRMDSMAKKDADKEEAEAKAKKDAEEKAEAEEKAKKDAAEKEEAAKKDAAEKEEAAKKDAAEKEEQAKKDAAASSGDPALRAMIADLEKRIPTVMTQADTVKFTDALRRAEKVVQAFGDSGGADRWANGESYDAYRRRLLGKFKSHSARWKDAELAAFADKALDQVEEQIYADAYQAAIAPASTPAGTLRQHIETDETGRKIKSFTGDPEACWGPFKASPRIVSGINIKFPH